MKLEHTRSSPELLTLVVDFERHVCSHFYGCAAGPHFIKKRFLQLRGRVVPGPRKKCLSSFWAGHKFFCFDFFFFGTKKFWEAQKNQKQKIVKKVGSGFTSDKVTWWRHQVTTWRHTCYNFQLLRILKPRIESQIVSIVGSWCRWQVANDAIDW